MKWMISEDKLGKDQLDVIEEISKMTNKPIWIQGYAGSGKSVLLLHSLKDYLARNPNANVCVAVFTWALVDLLNTGLKQIPFLRDKTIPVYTIYQLKKKLDAGARYSAIFCDEVQDLPIEIITQLKRSCDNLIVAGDAAQSIYPKEPNFNLPTAKPEEIVTGIAPVEKKLRVVYRLTKSVVDMLKNVFPDMLAERPIIGNVDTEIKLFKAPSAEDEIKYTWEEAKETNELRTSEVIVILLYGHDPIISFVNTVLSSENKPIWVRVNNPGNNNPDYASLNSHLESHGIPLMYIGNSYGSLTRADSDNKIVIMTYHGAKGLDYDYVYLPLTGDEMWLHRNVPVNSLLLVALSRSKSGLTITFTGELFWAYQNFLKRIPVKPIPKKKTNNDEIVF